MKRYTIMIGIILFLLNGPKAQNDSIISLKKSINKDISLDLSWSTAVPMGDMTEQVKITSGRGVQFGLSQNINDRFSYGGSFAWQMFFNKSYEMYINNASVLTGWKRDYINAFMLLGTGKYYFSTSVNKIKAYLSIEMGASIIENYQIFGINEYKELEWHFALNPSVGLEIPASKNLGFYLYIKYPNSFSNNSSFHYSWINSGIGVYLKIPD